MNATAEIMLVGGNRIIKIPKSFRSSMTAAISVLNSVPKPTRKMTALELQHLKTKGRKITMITAYDYPSAKHADYAVIRPLPLSCFVVFLIDLVDLFRISM